MRGRNRGEDQRADIEFKDTSWTDPRNKTGFHPI